MDILTRLKEVSPCVGSGLSAFPKWFQELYTTGTSQPFKVLVDDAIKEIEDLRAMRESYSKLYKLVYGSS